MNRRLTALFLGLIFFIQIFFFSGFSGVFAQTVEKAALYGPVVEDSLFQTTIRQIDSSVAVSSLSAVIKGDLKLVQALITNAKLIYEDEIDRNYTTPETSVMVYKNALAVVVSFANQQKGLNPSLAPEASAILNSWINKINTEQQAAEYIKAVSTGTSISTTSQQIAAQNAGQVQQSTVGQSDPSKCSLLPTTWGWCLDGLITFFIKTILLNFVTIFTWMFGMMFHYSIYFGVLNFETLVGGATISPLLKIWEMVRNLVNLVVIFFGFGLAILYLINRGDNLKKFIPWLIVYVLFVNFSWTMSRTLVDYSNIATLKMYEIAVPNALANTNLSFSGESAATMLMSRLGMQTLVTKITKGISSTGTTDSATKLEDNIKSTPVALLYVLMAGYLAYVFLIAAALFAIRSVLLMTFIVFSPFLLVDVALPWVGEYVGKARKLFYSQLAVGFIFMVFLFVALGVMDAINKGFELIKNPSGQSAALDVAASPGILSFFGLLVMLIVLHFMIKSVKMLSPMVGEATSVVAGAALGVASGGTAFAARATLGAAASRFAGSATLDRMQGSRIGRGLKTATNRVANGSMDLRNLSSVQSFAKKGGLKVGESKSGGYSKDFELKSINISDKARGISDTVAREKFLASKGKASELYRTDREKRERIFTKKYATTEGREKQEMFNKNADLRNVALEKDRTAADAENKTKTPENLLAKYKKDRDTAGYTQRNIDRGHEEFATDSTKNWSEAKSSTGPGPIDFDPKEIKDHVDALKQTNAATIDLATALKGLSGKVSSTPPQTAYAEPMPAAASTTINAPTNTGGATNNKTVVDVVKAIAEANKDLNPPVNPTETRAAA